MWIGSCGHIHNIVRLVFLDPFPNFGKFKEEFYHDSSRALFRERIRDLCVNTLAIHLNGYEQRYQENSGFMNIFELV
jgi:hypothetical protein